MGIVLRFRNSIAPRRRTVELVQNGDEADERTALKVYLVTFTSIALVMYTAAALAVSNSWSEGLSLV